MVIPFLNRFLHWFIAGLMTPVLALMILSKGSSLENIGLVVAAYSAVIVILEVPSGILSDIIGRKKIYLAALASMLAGILIVYFSESFLPVLIGFIFYGISRAFSSGSIETIFINDFIKKQGNKNLHKLMTVLGAGETLGLSTGALCGGLIPDFWQNLSSDGSPYNGNLLIQTFILIFLTFLTIFFTHEYHENRKIDIKKHLQKSFYDFMSNRILKLMLLSFFIFGFTLHAIELYWQPQLKTIINQEGMTWIFGIANSGYFVAALLGSLFISGLYHLKKFSYLNTLFFARLITGILLIFLSQQQTIPSFLGFYWILFFFNGVGNIPETTIFNLETSEDNRSSMLSISSLTLQLGGISGSLIYSGIILFTGIPFIWILSGTIFILSSFIFIYAKKCSKY